MNSDIMVILVEGAVTVLTTVLIPLLFKFLTKKAAQADAATETTLITSYVEEIETVITKCVLATKQTYVDALKANDTFTKEAQAEALAQTLANVKSILSAEVINYIETIATDATTYLTQFIEAKVAETK